MIELKLFDKPETKTSESLVNDMFYGAAAGMGTALVTASAAAFYYAYHVEGMTLPQCCSYTAVIDILLSKPILISGAAAGSIAGGLTYLVRKNR